MFETRRSVQLLYQMRIQNHFLVILSFAILWFTSVTEGALTGFSLLTSASLHQDERTSTPTAPTYGVRFFESELPDTYLTTHMLHEMTYGQTKWVCDLGEMEAPKTEDSM